jgi:hypothetical protein
MVFGRLVINDLKYICLNNSYINILKDSYNEKKGERWIISDINNGKY